MSLPHTDIPALPAGKRKSGIWIVVTIFVGAMLCVLACSGLGLYGLYSQFMERKTIRTTLETYVQSVADGDFNSAYMLLTSAKKRKTTLPEFQQNMKENEFFFYMDYQRLFISGFGVHSDSISSLVSRASQKTTATITGQFLYKDNSTCDFRAVLEKVNGEWNVSEVEVFPPEEANPISMVVPVVYLVG